MVEKAIDKQQSVPDKTQRENRQEKQTSRLAAFVEMTKSEIAQKTKRAIAIGVLAGAALLGQQGMPANLVRPAPQQVYYVGQKMSNGIVKRIDPYFQLGLVYKNSANELRYQVVAKPANNIHSSINYELNGLTDKGDWYQLSLTSDSSNGAFSMKYENWRKGWASGVPDNKDAVSTPPTEVAFNGPVNSEDKIDLTLKINDGTVYMRAHDINTGAIAEKSFSSNSAKRFVGSKVQNGFFTGLMSEGAGTTNVFTVSDVGGNEYRSLNGHVAFSKGFETLSIDMYQHRHAIETVNGKPVEHFPKTAYIIGKSGSVYTINIDGKNFNSIHDGIKISESGGDTYIGAND